MQIMLFAVCTFESIHKGFTLWSSNKFVPDIVYRRKASSKASQVHSAERIIQEKRVQGKLMTTYYSKNEIPPSPEECTEQSVEIAPMWQKPTPSDIPLPMNLAMSSANTTPLLQKEPYDVVSRSIGAQNLSQPTEQQKLPLPVSVPIMEPVVVQIRPSIASNNESLGNKINIPSLPDDTSSQSGPPLLHFTNPLFNASTPPPASQPLSIYPSSLPPAISGTSQQTSTQGTIKLESFLSSLKEAGGFDALLKSFPIQPSM